MRKLILATASVLALGLAASSAGYAQQTGNSTQLPSSNAPSATMPPATGQPSPNGGTEQGMQPTAPMHLSQSQIRQVQQQLKTAGLYNGPIDGKMGPETRRAVMQFQQQNGLHGTGRIDQQTLAALGNAGNGPTNGAGSSTLPGNQPSGAGGLNGSGNPNMPSGSNGNLTPSTPNQH